MLVFALLVFGTMKFIWPHILNAMEERSRKIAQGLAAAEKGEQELTEARGRADVIVHEARERASHIIDQAQRSEEHTSELQSPCNLVCRLLLEKKKKQKTMNMNSKSVLTLS